MRPTASSSVRRPQEAHREPGALLARQPRVEGQQQARAVAADPVRCPGAAVRDRREARKRAIEQLARRATASVGDEADAAGVAFAFGIVERLDAHGSARAFPSQGSSGVCLPSYEALAGGDGSVAG